MPRKKARLTHKKKSPRKADIQAPGGLSQKEFAALTHDYGSFEVENLQHEPQKFLLGDMAYIQYQEPEDCDPNATDAYWIGEIKEIRANSADDVWVRVQWFWSPQEVAEVIGSFDHTICGKYEKLESDNCDIISVHTVIDHVEVKPFDETSIYQVFIEDDEWFARYKFLYDAKRITPKVIHTACAICKKPYTPGQVKIHHFCPRPSCRKFYHQSCLIKGGYIKTDDRRRFLETWPDIDRTCAVDDILDFCPPSKRLKRDGHKSREDSLCGKDLLSNIPPKLITIAEQQIIRGYQGGGIVGNITSVTAARSLIYRTLAANGVIPDDWETRVNVSAEYPDELPPCFCPSCYSPI